MTFHDSFWGPLNGKGLALYLRHEYAEENDFGTYLEKTSHFEGPFLGRFPKSMAAQRETWFDWGATGYFATSEEMAEYLRLNGLEDLVPQVEEGKMYALIEAEL